jgi:hypothetical protein
MANAKSSSSGGGGRSNETFQSGALGMTRPSDVEMMQPIIQQR